MSNFSLLIIVTYLFIVFTLISEPKLKGVKEWISRGISLVLLGFTLFFLFFDKGDFSIWLKLLSFIPLLYLAYLIFAENLFNFFRKTKLSSNKEKTFEVDNDLADHIFRAVDYLSKNKIGALITIEKKDDLSKFINKALLINADVTKELLTSIFVPTTAIHDGAVIIRGNKIVCAKAYYPSTKRTDLPIYLGTRHRAAIGISEQSDAFTIIVSEETGFVSVTTNKEIEYNISKETLNLYLEKFLKI